ncbi:ABC subfamily G member 21 [Rhyzopertha dominica]|nr:ABC subfamily G member 21 [Rhyzopertha dominica]
MDPSSAVYVKDAVKFYGKNQILKNLCMNVPRGNIYGLLGASGCGKTTLLSCIVGRKRLNSGEIWVLGGMPGTVGSGVPGPRVGYMPQDIALVGEFTVRDAVYYFGRILEMKEEDVESRFRSLSKLLNLPPDDRYIKNCSGGQQRRVSFAAAMVHQPELLILDEPTVGIDPVLRDSIWQHLVEISEKEKVAIIITTHYIEEARQAHKIGLMREGRLLAEESPSQLLNLFRKDTLEEVFLILSRRQEEGRLTTYDRVADDDNNCVIDSVNTSMASIPMSELGHTSTTELTETNNSKRSTAKRISGFGMKTHRLKALLNKNWMQFIRNYGGMAFVFLFPIVQTFCFLYAIGGDIRNIKLAVVNEETMYKECNITDFNHTAVPYSFSSCNFTDMSCRALKSLDNHMVEMVSYDSLPKAMDDAKHGIVTGVMYMAENFTESLERRIMDGRTADDEILEFSQLKIWLDMSNRQIGTTIKYKFFNLFIDFQKEVFKDCNYFPDLGDIPIKFNDAVYGDEDETYTVFVTPGMMLTIMFFLGTTLTSTIIITDRLEGVWDRSIVAGVTSSEILLTHFVVQMALILIQMLESVIITFGIYGMEYVGNITTIALILGLQGLCGMSYGLVWPLEGMPVGLRFIAKCLPFTLAIESLRNVISKGWSITHADVISGIGVELVWIVGFGIISAFLIKAKR